MTGNTAFTHLINGQGIDFKSIPNAKVGQESQGVEQFSSHFSQELSKAISNLPESAELQQKLETLVGNDLPVADWAALLEQILQELKTNPLQVTGLQNGATEALNGAEGSLIAQLSQLLDTTDLKVQAETLDKAIAEQTTNNDLNDVLGLIQQINAAIKPAVLDESLASHTSVNAGASDVLKTIGIENQQQNSLITQLQKSKDQAFSLTDLAKTITDTDLDPKSLAANLAAKGPELVTSVVGEQLRVDKAFSQLLQASHQQQSLQSLDGQGTPIASTLISTATGQNTAQGVPQTQIDAAFDSKAWTDNFAERVTMLSNQKLQAASIKLNPPELGPVHVRINVENDKTNMIFTSQYASVRDVIEQAIPRLREFMANSGVDLGQVDVSSQEQNTQAQGQGGNADSAQSQDSSKHAFSDLLSENTTNENNDSMTVRQYAINSSLIDYFA